MASENEENETRPNSKNVTSDSPRASQSQQAQQAVDPKSTIEPRQEVRNNHPSKTSTKNRQ
jgi:hypothetical protein